VIALAVLLHYAMRLDSGLHALTVPLLAADGVFNLETLTTVRRLAGYDLSIPPGAWCIGTPLPLIVRSMVADEIPAWIRLAGVIHSKYNCDHKACRGVANQR